MLALRNIALPVDARSINREKKRKREREKERRKRKSFFEIHVKKLMSYIKPSLQAPYVTPRGAHMAHEFPTLHCVVGQRVHRDPDTHRSLQNHSWISHFGLQEKYKSNTIMKVREIFSLRSYDERNI